MKTILIESRIDSNSILRILTQDRKINTADPNYNYYRQLANWANPGSVQSNKGVDGKGINLANMGLSDRTLIDKNKLASRYNNLGSLLSKLKDLMEEPGGYDPKNATSQLIQKTTLEILEKLSGIKNTNKQPESDKPSLYEGMDWTAEKAKRLNNANGEATSEILDKFYNDYYKIEYAGLKSPGEEDTTGIVAKLKSLDSILIPEFTKLGYNPSVNPLAQFLKILIKLKKENNSIIFDKLTANTYGAIHNSFVGNKLTGNTLGNYNDKHILFCEDLYNYKGLDIVKYLKLYSDTLSKAENTPVEPKQDKWVLAAKIFIQQDLSDENQSDKIQFTAKVNMLLNKQENLRIPTANNAKLRAFSEIEELYMYIFKAAPSAEKQEENSVLKAIVAGAKANNAMLDMIYHIASSEIFQKTFKDDITKVVTDLRNRQYKQNNELIERSKQILAPYIKYLKKEDLLTIVKTLFRTYDISKKRANK